MENLLLMLKCKYFQIIMVRLSEYDFVHDLENKIGTDIDFRVGKRNQLCFVTFHLSTGLKRHYNQVYLRFVFGVYWAARKGATDKTDC